MDASEPPIINSASVLADPAVGLQVSLNVLLHGVTSSGLLDDSDIGEISAAMQSDSVAVVVIYENR